MVVYTEERLDRRNLHISHEKYRERKEQYVEKLHHMVRYASCSSTCRSRFLLEYFGETDAYRCGQCDVCNKKNEQELSDSEFNSIYKQIRTHLLEQERSTEQLVELSDHAGDKVVKVIDWLLDNGKMIVSETGKLAWRERRNQAGKS